MCGQRFGNQCVQRTRIRIGGNLAIPARVLVLKKLSAQRSKRRIVQMLNLVFDGFNVCHDDESVARRDQILTT